MVGYEGCLSVGEVGICREGLAGSLSPILSPEEVFRFRLRWRPCGTYITGLLVWSSSVWSSDANRAARQSALITVAAPVCILVVEHRMVTMVVRSSE